MTAHGDGDRLVIFATKHHNARDFESMQRIVTTALHAFGYGATYFRLTDRDHTTRARDILEDRVPDPYHAHCFEQGRDCVSEVFPTSLDAVLQDRRDIEAGKSCSHRIIGTSGVCEACHEVPPLKGTQPEPCWEGGLAPHLIGTNEGCVTCLGYRGRRKRE